MKGAFMLKSLVSRIPALLSLLLFCFIIYLYVDGWFDISFIVRGDTEDSAPVSDTAASDDVTAPGADAPTTNAPATDPPATDAATEPPVTPETDAPAPFTPPSVDSLGGYSLSYSDYVPGGSFVLAEASVNVGAPGFFSSHTVEKNRVSYVSPGDNTAYQIVYTPYTVNAPAISLYMGYIMVESKSSGVVNIYTSQGTAVGSYKEKDVAPAYCRDASGRPLFISGGAYYYLDASSRRFALADYIPERDNRGALFDYTPDYGLSRENDRTFASNLAIINEEIPIEGSDTAYYVVPTEYYRFALSDRSGNLLGDYYYSQAFGFSESLAAVVDHSGLLSYITRGDATSIPSTRRYRDSNIKRNVIEFFMPPLTNGPESIGFYFFEHGLSRARIMTIEASPFDKEGKMQILSDETVMIDKSGKRFETPLGYRVEAYSNGMMLLRSNNGVGFMDYTGVWVVDPDLSDAEPYYEGLAVVKKNGQTALVDTAGNFVIPFGRYSYISNVSSGVIAAYDGSWHVLYKMSK